MKRTIMMASWFIIFVLASFLLGASESAIAFFNQRVIMAILYWVFIMFLFYAIDVRVENHKERIFMDRMFLVQIAVFLIGRSRINPLLILGVNNAIADFIFTGIVLCITCMYFAVSKRPFRKKSLVKQQMEEQ